ncbi:hypothetical protein LY90DRAFT_513293, partial [Neocallimastix californiae]
SFNSLKAKSVFSLNKSFHPYTNTSNESFNSERKVLKNNKFIYGNYEHYYGYRNKSSIPIDPRIELFEEEWFKNKICLDVGCNSGFLTTSIDIDKDLRESALKNNINVENKTSNNLKIDKNSSNLLSDNNNIFKLLIS